MDEHGIGTYPVGLLAAIKHRQIKSTVPYLLEQARNGNWRAVRNHFNGYLAEWHYPPNEVMHYRCGHGWTRKRALRNFGKHLVECNQSVQEHLK